PECLFHFPAFLNVAGFELSAFLRIQVEAGVSKRRFGLTLNHLTSLILSLTQDVPLLRTHPHPTLGVALKILPGFWGHREPPLSYALALRPCIRHDWRSANWSDRTMRLWLRLRSCAE